MRIGIVLFINLLFTTLMVWANDTLPVLKVGPDVYSNVVVTTVTPTDVYFTSDQGMANVKLKDIEPKLQDRLRQDMATVVKAAETMPKAAIAQNPFDVTIDRKNAKTIMDDAIFKVQDIVNQPVTHLKHTPDMKVAFFSPGWFHAGAIKPDFNTVDVRATQQLDYDPFPYVTSDLNPGEVFIGPELEFNPMTKYFYTDRLVPKKKLTQAEMLEINQLYRVIGHCEQQLDELQNPEPLLMTIRRLAITHKPVVIALVAVLLVALFFIRKSRAQA